jgi:hypothetical protein
LTRHATVGGTLGRQRGLPDIRPGWAGNVGPIAALTIASTAALLVAVVATRLVPRTHVALALVGLITLPICSMAGRCAVNHK